MIDKTPDETPDPLSNLIEQSDSDSENSEHPPPVFVSEGGNVVAQANEDNISIIPIKVPEEASPNIPLVVLDDASVASDSVQVANSNNLDEHEPEHLCKSKEIWECQSGHLRKTDKVTCTKRPNHIPTHTTRLFLKKLKNKQCYNLWNEIGDSMLNTMSLAPLTIEYLLGSPLSKFIIFAANGCGYSGAFTEIFVTAHPFFLIAKSETSKEDNPIWHQAMNRTLADVYWKAAEKEIDSLEGMGAWDVDKH